MVEGLTSPGLETLVCYRLFQPRTDTIADVYEGGRATSRLCRPCVRAVLQQMEWKFVDVLVGFVGARGDGRVSSSGLPAVRTQG